MYLNNHLSLCWLYPDSSYDFINYKLYVFIKVQLSLDFPIEKKLSALWLNFGNVRFSTIILDQYWWQRWERGSICKTAIQRRYFETFRILFTITVSQGLKIFNTNSCPGLPGKDINLILKIKFIINIGIYSIYKSNYEILR